MFDDRLEEFSRERLGGRPVPEDVRILAVAQWAERGHPFEQHGITVVEPGGEHPLTDHSYLTEEDRANPDIAANCAAFVQVAEYLKVVAQNEDGHCYGYWLHPQQRTDQPPPVVMVDSEGVYWTLSGRTFAEACLFDIAYGDDELFAEVAVELAHLGITIPAGSAEDLDETPADPDPADVHNQFYEAALARPNPPDAGR